MAESKFERALLLCHIIVQSGILATIKITILTVFGEEQIEYKYVEAIIHLVTAIGKGSFQK